MLRSSSDVISDTVIQFVNNDIYVHYIGTIAANNGSLSLLPARVIWHDLVR
jgi:hypothetical protein